MADTRKPWPKGKPRIFLGFSDIAAYQSNLKKGFVALGVPCTFVALFGDRFKYAEDDGEKTWTVRLFRRLWSAETKAWRWIEATSKLAILRLAFWVAVFRVLRAGRWCAQFAVFLWAAARHDVFVFSYNSSFFENAYSSNDPHVRRFRDAIWLRRLGKTVVFTFHGPDSRPPYVDGHIVRSEKKFGPAELVRLTRVRYETYRNAEAAATHVVNVPAQGYFASKPFVLHEVLGRPFDATSVAAVPDSERHGKPVRVLHSPSYPHNKGTAEIRAAVACLKERGLAFEYVEVTGKLHKEVLAEMAASDLVIDQNFSDRPISGIATEAAYLGRATILGGYYADFAAVDYARAPGAFFETVFCLPGDIEATIERCIRTREAMLDLGARAREFVRREYQPTRVADRWLAMLEGRLPAEAYYDPAGLSYPYGYGLSSEDVHRAVRSVVAEAGASALCLDHHPVLRDRILALSGVSGGGS